VRRVGARAGTEHEGGWGGQGAPACAWDPCQPAPGVGGAAGMARCSIDVHGQNVQKHYPITGLQAALARRAQAICTYGGAWRARPPCKTHEAPRRDLTGVLGCGSGGCVEQMGTVGS